MQSLFMNKRDESILKDLGWLKDILASANSIEKITEDITFEDFDSDMLQYLSVTRLFEIIGEATKNLSTSLKEEYRDIPWKEMAGMRDILIHAYRDADNEIIWDTVQNKIPGLIDKISKLIGQLEN